MEEIFEIVRETPNDMELGKRIREVYHTHQQKIEEYTESIKDKWIYESPDGGKTVTKRAFCAPLSERIIITDTKKFINPYKVTEVVEDWYKRNEA